METDALRDRMLSGLPVTHRMLDIDGVATSVLEAGSGPPLVLLHGGIECGGIMWAPVLAKLAERHRVVVPDVPGLGESAPMPRLNVDTFTRWFSTFLDVTTLDRPALVAHSLVGSLATRFATRHGGLVVCGAPAIGAYRMPNRLRYVAIRFAIRPTERNAERFDRFALLDLDSTRQIDPGWYEAFETYTRARAVERHVKKAMSQLIPSQTKAIDNAELDRIVIPTALLWGRHDRMVPLCVAEEASARHGWTLHVVDHAAHAPQIEQPEEFVRTLAACLG